MLLLAFISHLIAFPAQRPGQTALPRHAAIGHAGLTIIALVYVLIFMWQS